MFPSRAGAQPPRALPSPVLNTLFLCWIPVSSGERFAGGIQCACQPVSLLPAAVPSEPCAGCGLQGQPDEGAALQASGWVTGSDVPPQGGLPTSIRGAGAPSAWWIPV